jgi:sulfate permease, SulP family
MKESLWCLRRPRLHSGVGPATRGANLHRMRPWWKELDGATVRADALAGLLAAMLVLPQGIAFATLAGLPPAWGLYGAVVPCVVAALVGSSRLVLTGPTNALSLALAAALAPLAVAGSAEYLRLALVVTLFVGLLQVAVALLRLGSLAEFISPSVLLGFTSGAALLIAWHAARQFTSLGAAGIGALTIAVALLLRWAWPRGPGLLIALAAGAAASVWLLPAAMPVERVGALPSPWPSFSLPAFAWGDVQRLAGIAAALTVVAIGQAMAIAKLVAERTGQALDANRECLGQGLANVSAAFSSAFVVSGSLNRSTPHIEAGAKTPLAAVFAAVILVAAIALAAPLLAQVPLAAIAALLLLVAWGLIDRTRWRELFALDRREAYVAAGTLVATLLLPLQVAVLAGVAASLVVYLHRTAHPALRTMGFDGPPQPDADRRFVVLPPGAPECPQLKLLRMEGTVWFGAVSHVGDALRSLRDAPEPARHLLVMAKSMNFIDAAGAALWERERQQRLAMKGGLYFHRARPEVLATWQASGFIDRLGAQHLYPDKRSAIAAIVPRLDEAICAACRARVFEECTARPGAATAISAAASTKNPPAPAAPRAP